MKNSVPWSLWAHFQCSVAICMAAVSDGENAEHSHGRRKFCWAYVEADRDASMAQSARVSRIFRARYKNSATVCACTWLPQAESLGLQVCLRPLLMGAIYPSPIQLLGALRQESLRSISGWPAREHRIRHRSFTAYQLHEPGDKRDLEVRLCAAASQQLLAHR